MARLVGRAADVVRVQVQVRRREGRSLHSSSSSGAIPCWRACRELGQTQARCNEGSILMMLTMAWTCPGSGCEQRVNWKFDPNTAFARESG